MILICSLRDNKFIRFRMFLGDVTELRKYEKSLEYKKDYDKYREDFQQTDGRYQRVKFEDNPNIFLLQTYTIQDMIDKIKSQRDLCNHGLISYVSSFKKYPRHLRDQIDDRDNNHLKEQFIPREIDRCDDRDLIDKRREETLSDYEDDSDDDFDEEEKEDMTLDNVSDYDNVNFDGINFE